MNIKVIPIINRTTSVTLTFRNKRNINIFVLTLINRLNIVENCEFPCVPYDFQSAYETDIDVTRDIYIVALELGWEVPMMFAEF